MPFDSQIYHWSKYTILIVEDDVSSTFYLKEVLKDTGVKFLYAADGMQAVAFCRNKIPPDLILMDIKLPVMNGIDATKAIRVICPDIPIIAQTANAFFDTRLLCIDAGCNDFIAKPIDAVDLLEKISFYLK